MCVESLKVSMDMLFGDLYARSPKNLAPTVSVEEVALAGVPRSPRDQKGHPSQLVTFLIPVAGKPTSRVEGHGIWHQTI